MCTEGNKKTSLHFNAPSVVKRSICMHNSERIRFDGPALAKWTKCFLIARLEKNTHTHGLKCHRGKCITHARELLKLLVEMWAETVDGTKSRQLVYYRVRISYNVRIISSS